MQKKPLILTFIAIALITVFFLLPRNSRWARTVYAYWTDYKWQRHNTDIETRMIKRFGNNYAFSKQIAEMFEKRGGKDRALVLMPPSSYFTKLGVSYQVPEPAVFYYYTGLKTIWANSNDAIKANWYVRASGNLLVVDSVTDLNAFRDTIAAYKKLRPSL
jgi:4-amino-4-deoxy-L-arabinose transferase-like glycosyltransferase